MVNAPSQKNRQGKKFVILGVQQVTALPCGACFFSGETAPHASRVPQVSPNLVWLLPISLARVCVRVKQAKKPTRSPRSQGKPVATILIVQVTSLGGQELSSLVVKQKRN